MTKRTEARAKPTAKSDDAFNSHTRLFAGARCSLSRTFFLAPCSSDISIAKAFISSSFNRSCYEGDNGYKTHRAKRSCLFQVHYKNDDSLVEGIRKQKREAIWQSTLSFLPSLARR